MSASDDFFNQAPPEREPSRPRAVNPVTGQEQSWQRASNYAAVLDNPHGLIKWKLRELIKGISARPDLARMLLSGAVIEDNAKADEIIAAAHAVAAIDAKANEGTAIHSALSRSWQGKEWAREFEPHVLGFAAELKRNGLRPVATEVTVMNTRLGALGHVDWVLQDAHGNYLVGDLKSGNLERAALKFAVQCEVYNSADYILDENNRPAALPWKLGNRYSVLIHIDPETGACSIYSVDAVLGLYGADLAEKVRDWQKMKVLRPYVPPIGDAPAVGIGVDECTGTIVAATQRPGEPTHLQVVAAHDGNAPAKPLCAHGYVLNQDSCPNCDAEEQPETVVAGTALDAPGRREARVSVVTEIGTPDYERRLAELMSLHKTKPAMQQAAHALGCRDLAHNRKWLADWIIRAENSLASGPQTLTEISNAEVPAHEQVFVTEPQASPEQPGDLTFMIKSIQGAKSVAAIKALKDNLTERRGDQAWTDEMTEAARARTAELDGSKRQEVLNSISVAVEPKEIADLWAEVTASGTMPSLWTEEFKNAADAQLRKIQAAAPPVNNPYGG